MAFEKILEAIEKLLQDPEIKDNNDILGPIRLKVLAAGMSAANTMSKYAELAEPCIKLLLTHMEVYGDLVIATQNMSIDIPKEESDLATILNQSTVMGES